MNPAALSAAEASVAEKVNDAGVPWTSPGGTVTDAVGASSATLSVDVSASTDAPSVICTPIVSGPAGPSLMPRALRWAAVTVGVGPVASSNWLSLSRSQA